MFGKPVTLSDHRVEFFLVKNHKLFSQVTKDAVELVKVLNERTAALEKIKKDRSQVAGAAKDRALNMQASHDRAYLYSMMGQLYTMICDLEWDPSVSITVSAFPVKEVRDYFQVLNNLVGRCQQLLDLYGSIFRASLKS